jgi:hypothetical protein
MVHETNVDAVVDRNPNSHWYESCQSDVHIKAGGCISLKRRQPGADEIAYSVTEGPVRT